MALGHIITAVYSSENRFLSLLVTRDREAEVLTASLLFSPFPNQSRLFKLRQLFMEKVIETPTWQVFLT